MKSDIHSALASVGEVAVFAWSLLELLLTRILPLLGFLIGHLLLQCFRFFAAIFNPAAAAGRQRKLSRGDDEQQQFIRYGDLNPVKTTAAAAHSVEDVILDDYELLQNQQLPTASQADSRSEALLENTVSSPAEDHLPLPQVLHLKPINGQTADLLPNAGETADLLPSTPPINGEQSAMPPSPTESANVATSDAQAINDCAPKQMQQKIERPSERSDQEASDSLAVKKVSEQDAESAPNSEVVTDRQAGSAEMGTSAAPNGEGETAQSGRSGSRKRPAFTTRVLPPSLSQVKRTLMQRSRRGTSPPSSSSPKPSSRNMKRQSPRLRKLGSAMISPGAYGNFLGAFRKHFLIDSA